MNLRTCVDRLIHITGAFFIVGDFNMFNLQGQQKWTLGGWMVSPYSQNGLTCKLYVNKRTVMSGNTLYLIAESSILYCYHNENWFDVGLASKIHDPSSN